jgi:exodeoxyribonuclease VII small subunit
MTSSAAPTPDPAVQALPFDAAMQELEDLVAQIAAGQLPLEELIAGYERGAALLQHCQAKLQAVEAQIKVMEAGQLKAWDASA